MVCARGHSFDFARSGYINLLQVQERRAKDPGDSLEAMAARRRLHERGVTAIHRAAIAEALATTPFGAYRQLLVVAREGTPLVHSGEHALGIVAGAIGRDAAAAGNLLADPGVPQAMIGAFESSGSRNWLFSCRKIGSLSPTGARSPKKPEHTPWRP